MHKSTEKAKLDINYSKASNADIKRCAKYLFLLAYCYVSISAHLQGQRCFVKCFLTLDRGRSKLYSGEGEVRAKSNMFSASQWRDTLSTSYAKWKELGRPKPQMEANFYFSFVNPNAPRSQQGFRTWEMTRFSAITSAAVLRLRIGKSKLSTQAFLTALRNLSILDVTAFEDLVYLVSLQVFYLLCACRFDDAKELLQVAENRPDTVTRQSSYSSAPCMLMPSATRLRRVCYLIEHTSYHLDAKCLAMKLPVVSDW